MPTKPRTINWTKLRTAYEAGETIVRLAQVFNVKKDEIRQKAHDDRWGPNASEEQYKAELELKRLAAAQRASAAGALYTLPPEQRTALAQQLLTRYLRGESPAALERDSGVERRVLTYIMLGGMDGEASAELVTQALMARIAHTEEMLENATTQVEQNKWERLSRFARQDLQNRRGALYGPNRPATERRQPPDFGDRLRRAKERTTEHGRHVAEVEPEAEKAALAPATTPATPAPAPAPTPSKPRPQIVPDSHWSVVPGVAYAERHGRQALSPEQVEPKKYDD